MSNRQALSTAIRSGRVNRVREAVSRNGTSILSTPETSPTRMYPLHRAADLGHLGIVQYMLEQGARPNVRDANGRTPLHLAARRGHINIVRTLLVSGAQVNALNRRRQTPLHLAAQYGHLYVVRLLAERGASLNRRDDTGKTPLHHGAERDHRGIVTFLVSRGARLDLANRDGRTPIDAVRSNTMRLVMRYIDQQPSNIANSMSRLALQRNRSPPRRRGAPPPPPLPPPRRAPNRISPVRQPARWVTNEDMFPRRFGESPIRQPARWAQVVPSSRVRNTSRTTPTRFRRGNARHRTNANTTYVNTDFVPVNGIANIPANKRAYLDVDVNANGTIKHVYHRDGLVAWIRSQGGRAPSPFTRRPVTYSDVRMLA